MSDSSNEYKGIFKTTFLFGFVQVVKMLVSLVKNKIIALLLGPEGIGIISIYNNVVNLIRTGASLGVSQSAVRDVSEAYSSGDKERYYRIIKITNRIVLFTSLLGCIITIATSSLLSEWNFGNRTHTLPFIFLSVSISLDIFVDNQLAILKGIRVLNDLAKSSMYGSVLALILGIPSILIWKEQGIILSFIMSSLAFAIISNYYVRKNCKVNDISVTVKETLTLASPMLKMGVALMLSNFLAFFTRLIIAAYVRKEGGMDYVGYYNAGMTVVNTYFSMVTTALITDYYPRISAINKDNNKLSTEITKQAIAGLLLFLPLVSAFILFSNLFISVLYTKEFLIATQYTNIAVVGLLVSVVSDCYGYVFIAKQDTKVFLSTAVLFNVLLLPIYIILFDTMSIKGLGIAYTLNNTLQLIIYVLLAKIRYSIKIDYKLLAIFIAILIYVAVLLFSRLIINDLLRVVVGLCLVVLSVVISFYYMQKITDIKLFDKLKKKS